jgi:MoaA/NifB/PqqE/SkfB family radical SAM enzyme
VNPRALARAGLTTALAQARLRPAPDTPTQVHLSVTDRCFLPCLHCDIWKNEAEDLPEATWAGVIDGLARWLGPASMNFVGGEPLLRKDLERLMARATRLGFTVTFNTNGWLLTEKRANALAEAGVSIAYVSMDGLRPETVDRSRGRAGSHAKAVAACDTLDRVPNPRVVITCILNGDNAREIPGLLAWAKDRGYQLVVQPLYQNFGENAYDPTWWRRSPLWPKDLGPIDDAIDALIAEREGACQVCNSVAQLRAFKRYFRDPTSYNGEVCRAGHSDLAFDPAGNVRLCYFLEPVGNITDGRDLPRIWNAVATMRRRHEVHRCTRSCNLLNCNFDQG